MSGNPNAIASVLMLFICCFLLEETRTYLLPLIIQFFHLCHVFSAGCAGGSTVDLILVLDSSGSVGFRNFQVVKKFVYQIIDALPIGPKVFMFNCSLAFRLQYRDCFSGCASWSDHFHTWTS